MLLDTPTVTGRLSLVSVPARRTLPWPALGLAAACLLAAALRLWHFDRVPPNPFYDAAVRSMGLSWRNFFYGAFEPGASLSVDKAPVDLWLQVASTKLLGFSSISLRLPQAIAGTLAVPLLYDLVRRGFGRQAGLIAALALAVLPVSVLTSRSDTMDTLMGTLLLLAAWVIVAAPPRHRSRSVLLAGAVAGLAFEVKLFEAVVALPALGLMVWLATDGSRAARRAAVLRASAAFATVAAAWPVIASLTPGAHPWAIGSSDGSIWNVILVFNGLNRLGAPGTGSSKLAPASPWRLFTTTPPDYLTLLGMVLLPALIFGALALLAARRGLGSPGRASMEQRVVGLGMGAWLATGFVLFCVQGRLRLRYMEAFTPAVAAVLGIGIVVCLAALGEFDKGRSRSCASGGIALALVIGLLSAPLLTSIDLARAGAEDSQTLGALPAAQVDSLSRYLHSHQRAGGYEVAASWPVVAGPLIVRDAEPVLMLTSWEGRPLTSTAALERAVRSGAVRHLLIDDTRCLRRHAPACAPAARWAVAHSTDVSAAAGLRPGRTLLSLTAP